MESGISLVKQHFSVRDLLQKVKSQQRGVHKANSKQFLKQGKTTTKSHVKITFHSINQYRSMDKMKNPGKVNFHPGV
jgi:hypothetical protein